MKNPLSFRRLLFSTAILISLLITWSCEEPLAHASIITSEVEDVTIARATCGGFIADDGGSTITDRGIIWGLVPYINLLNNSGITHDSTGTGKFISKMTGLIPNTQYYIRAYAVSDWGVYYGLPKAFTTDNGIVDIEENEYHFVTIGTQIWLKENLKTATYNDGSPITLLTNELAYTDPTYCWYNFDEANKDIYGGYYSYAAVTTGKLCPTGWHVPSKTEWETLANFMGGSLVAGKKLKTTTGWYNFGNGTDEYGFSGKPAGYRLNDFDEFYYPSQVALWWIANEQSTRYIKFDMDYLYHMTIMNPTSNAVRCIKD